MSTPKNFDVTQVPLDNKNLIEASAGTGKTYSVAIMVLRLILEKEIRINQILMVTFTKAAVAELEERIRRFVRLAQRYAHKEAIGDDSIKKIVDSVAQEKGMEFVQDKLKSAVINLDETAVLTIHSFCQQTLTEFAFETNQLFNAEMLSDLNPVLEEATQKFWRENITGMDKNLLSNMLNHGLSIASIMDVVKNHMDGKLFYLFDSDKNYDLIENEEKVLEELEAASNILEHSKDILLSNIEDEREELKRICEGHGSAKKTYLSLINDSASFCKQLKKHLKDGTDYPKKIFPEIVRLQEIVNESEEIVNNIAVNSLQNLYKFALQKIIPDVERKKTQFNQMTFDDVITKLYFALNRENTNQAKQKLQQDLIRQLQWKYKAVFIDEFQDTDALQYAIFQKAFENNTILFFIGDPKQSIYAWRKADIETYFEARRNVDRQYSMQTNYRSSKNLVDALNHFFLPEVGFDTFYYETDSENGEESAIEYIPVSTPKGSTKGEMHYGGEAVVPVSVYTDQNKGNIRVQVVKQISDLLNNPEYTIKGRRIKPSDIGILVRSNAEANDIKASLSRVNIPAVTVTDSKVVQSLEAHEMVYILDAILNHSRAKVNRVLTTSFINWTPDEILRLDEDVIIERFRNYLLKWQQSGIYAALTDFIHGFQIQQNLLSAHTENGERIITNLYHLMEVLYRTENRQHFGPAELLDWLKINRNKPESSDDEMIQRVESDEDAVRIVTIHSSKGLEYNIVIAPSLDFAPRSKAQDKDKIIGIRNADGQYISIKRSEADDEMERLYNVQSEQENRRLLYVALTRAVYKCFVYRNTHYKSSSLKTFLDAINLEESQGLIEEIPALENTPKAYRPEKESEQFPLKAKNFQLAHRNWTRTSYSSLAADMEYIKRENYTLKEDEYDDFVFRELTKGAKTGNFIHHIFETIDFADSERWEFAIERAIGRFVPDKKEAYPEKIETFLKQVLQTEITAGKEKFKLSDIPHTELLHEMEFDFPMELFSIKSLEKLIENGVTVKNPEDFPQQIEGIMTGFVDLFFRHNGKFYVLDWKTNYLGPSLEDYNQEAVSQAMTDNNYHLQYLIYSYAVKLYLEHRLGDSFDYERDFGGAIYLFVRGMRNGQNTGIYFSKPSVEQMGLMKEAFGS
ncbi:exodeoxyribonuclease V subunit beta [Aequorivita sp. H23M31]|uniref:RecBCD enzyme subunit RecB n=1 Tax=Aequorivita ciconiae TaxID=2494375 RepID=A0A410G0C4_9FLAO|nr:exodeoxyribonuclease V subunit beta [Aequorivita sp. H23M31]QAA80724.1 exodeoxyribonuclease V subunit beta [Aequorivita sp. H23M31]